jgi:hypothetical protein
LQRIADGVADDNDRREHRLLEAELRDRIRGRALAAGPLLTEIREARARGVDVALLDDVRDRAPVAEVLEPGLTWAAERVAAVTAGTATIRLALADGAPVVTFATGEGGAATFRLPAAA